MQTPKNFEFIAVNQAAKLIGVTVGRIRQMLLSGELEGFKPNERAWLIPRKEVERILKNPPQVGRPRSRKKA